MDIEKIMSELAQYSRIAEETAAIIDGLKDTLKAYMMERGIDHIAGAEHKASYKAVTTSRIDTTALKKELPDVAAQYTRVSETKRFTFC